MRVLSLTITAVELFLEDLLGVLLGLLGSVGVVDGSLVAAGDLSIGHFEGCGWCVGAVGGAGYWCCCCWGIAV